MVGDFGSPVTQSLSNFVVEHCGASAFSPEIDIRRSDAMTACTLLTPEPTTVLTSSPLPQLRRLLVTATDHEVVITGRVTSYYMKQLAQESVRSSIGSRRLLNHVEVCPRG